MGDVLFSVLGKVSVTVSVVTKTYVFSNVAVGGAQAATACEKFVGGKLADLSSIDALDEFR